MEAWNVACNCLPAFAHRNSPQKFTQQQLFACLVLKNFLRLDYRGLSRFLHDSRSLMEAIQLTSVPHFTTFQKAAQRLLQGPQAQRLLDETVEQMLGRKRNEPKRTNPTIRLRMISAPRPLNPRSRRRIARSPFAWMGARCWFPFPSGSIAAMAGR